MTKRFFRSDETTYEAIRLQLDAAWGHGPNTGATTCYEPFATALRDAGGRALLAVAAKFCDFESVSALLPGLLASGAVEEIDAETFFTAIQKPLP
jgi:hypothetical protein